MKEAIKLEAKSSEQYHELAEVSDAETATKTGNGSKVVEHLKKAGVWTLKVAQDIGTKVAADVIKKIYRPLNPLHTLVFRTIFGGRPRETVIPSI